MHKAETLAQKSLYQDASSLRGPSVERFQPELSFHVLTFVLATLPLVNYSVYDLRAKSNENFIADVKSIGNRGVQFGMKYRFHVSEFN